MKKQRRQRKLKGVFAVVLIAVLYTLWALYRPLPPAEPSLVANPPITAPAGTIHWPAHGQSAVSPLNSPVIATRGEQKPVPMASTAKIITALVVLEKYPLQPGETGPVISITDADVAIYNQYVSQNGSVAPVRSGDKLTQYQMLQALMLPSANNIADTLAIWAFGSLDKYKVAANSYILRQGLANTKVGSDASGLSPDSMSTAYDLVRLGKLAIKHPVLAGIVSQPTATGFPNTDALRSTNFLLGVDGIIGIKTGTSDQAGAAFVGAAKKTVYGRETLLVSAVLGAPDRISTLQPSRQLLNSAAGSFSNVEVIRKNQVVATYTTEWGATSRAVTTKAVTCPLWPNEKIVPHASLTKIHIEAASRKAGMLSVPRTALAGKQEIAVALEKPLAEPSIVWRLLNPL